LKGDFPVISEPTKEQLKIEQARTIVSSDFWSEGFEREEYIFVNFDVRSLQISDYWAKYLNIYSTTSEIDESFENNFRLPLIVITSMTGFFPPRKLDIKEAKFLAK